MCFPVPCVYIGRVQMELWIDFVGILTRKCLFWYTFSGLGRLGGTCGNKVTKRTTKKPPKTSNKPISHTKPSPFGTPFSLLEAHFCCRGRACQQAFSGNVFCHGPGTILESKRYPKWSPNGRSGLSEDGLGTDSSEREPTCDPTHYLLCITHIGHF